MRMHICTYNSVVVHSWINHTINLVIFLVNKGLWFEYCPYPDSHCSFPSNFLSILTQECGMTGEPLQQVVPCAPGFKCRAQTRAPITRFRVINNLLLEPAAVQVRRVSAPVTSNLNMTPPTRKTPLVKSWLGKIIQKALK